MKNCLTAHNQMERPMFRVVPGIPPVPDVRSRVASLDCGGMVNQSG